MAIRYSESWLEQVVASSAKLADTIANNLGPAISSDGARLLVGTYSGKLMALTLP